MNKVSNFEKITRQLKKDLFKLVINSDTFVHYFMGFRGVWKEDKRPREVPFDYLFNGSNQFSLECR